MSSPVKQLITDHVAGETEGPVADPSPYTADVDWTTGFEFGGAR